MSKSANKKKWGLWCEVIFSYDDIFKILITYYRYEDFSE